MKRPVFFPYDPLFTALSLSSLTIILHLLLAIHKHIAFFTNLRHFLFLLEC